MLEQCARCGARDFLLVHMRSKLKDGSIKVHFWCKDCNTKRSREYRKTLSGKMAFRKAVKKSIAKFPYKQKARVEVREAVRKQKLTKPTECCKCKRKAKVEAHHNNYSKPLVVKWVCRSCHALIHLQFKKNRGKMEIQLNK